MYPDDGLYLGIPEEIYHQRELGVASNSMLKILRNRSPAHYRAECLGEIGRKETPALREGKIIHACVLEPKRFEQMYQVAPDFGDLRSSANRAGRDRFFEQHPGVTWITYDELNKAMNIRSAILSHRIAAAIIAEGEAEVTLRWTDKRTGLKCKGRVDWRHKGLGFYMDLKSTDDASPKAFARSVVKYDYHVQHCFYSEGSEHVDDKPISNYLILACEKEPPYAVGVYHIDAAAEDRGFEVLHASMNRLAECVKNNHYPAYGEGINCLTLPGYAFYD